MSNNEAADRLREYFHGDDVQHRELDEALATERWNTVERLAEADHEWSEANGRVHCAAHFLPVRPCTVADHIEWATAILDKIGAER